MRAKLACRITKPFIIVASTFQCFAYVSPMREIVYVCYLVQSIHVRTRTSPNLRLVKWKDAEKYLGVTRFPSPTSLLTCISVDTPRPFYVRPSVHIVFLYIIICICIYVYTHTHIYIWGIHRDIANLYGSLVASNFFKPPCRLPQFKLSHRTNIHFSYNKICVIRESPYHNLYVRLKTKKVLYKI